MPDMTSSTDSYLKLQEVYQGKAAADREAMGKHLQAIISERGIDASHITADDLALFCKNTNHL